MCTPINLKVTQLNSIRLQCITSRPQVQTSCCANSMENQSMISQSMTLLLAGVQTGALTISQQNSFLSLKSVL